MLKVIWMKKNKSKAESKIKKNKNKRGFKKLPLYVRVIIIVLASIIVAGGMGTGGFFLYINSVNRTINSITTSEVENILAPIESPQEPVTILLMGRDSRDVENDSGRADTIMLLYLNPEEGSGVLLSIPRDTLVEIPGYGEDKINHAYAYGGEELMIKTVSSFLDAEINHYVTLDFEGFVRLIDALGGVDITIDRPLVDPRSGANFSPGNHHFTGEQALSYTRSRATELGDIGRIQRQQQLSRELLIQKLNVRYLSNVPYYFNVLVENTRTDLDILTILKYSKAALSLNSENFETAIIPSRSDWIENRTISVQIPDIEEARAMWKRIINGEPASLYNAVYTDIGVSPDAMASNVGHVFKIKIKNTGAITWERDNENPVFLGYHWIDFESKEMVVFEGKRSFLPQKEVKPGEEAVFNINVKAPSAPGQYVLQIDLVQEGVTWFSTKGVLPLEKYIVVDIAYSAKYDDFGTTPKNVDPGEKFPVTIWFKNTGIIIWKSDSEMEIRFGYHWLNRDTMEVVIWDDGRRLPIPGEIGPGDEFQKDIYIVAPENPGRYILQYDLVHEKITWFSTAGVMPLGVDVDVGRVIDKSITGRTYIIISNGNGISGSAVKFKDYLKVYGFKILGLSNADSYNYEKTVIYYSKENKEKADQLAIIFSSYEMEELPSSIFKEIYGKDADVAIIVGKDYLENLE